jgi:glucose-inhibited division protein A
VTAHFPALSVLSVRHLSLPALYVLLTVCIQSLQALGFESDRLKTGTPARVDRRTIDFSVLEEQPGEEELRWFSHDPAVHIPREQLACHMTRTTAATHELIRANLHETPTYGGWVEARGPRYCPSIEDKIVRFADKESHQIFLEPEGARRWCSSSGSRREAHQGVGLRRAHRNFSSPRGA